MKMGEFASEGVNPDGLATWQPRFTPDASEAWRDRSPHKLRLRKDPRPRAGGGLVRTLVAVDTCGVPRAGGGR